MRLEIQAARMRREARLVAALDMLIGVSESLVQSVEDRAVAKVVEALDRLEWAIALGKQVLKDGAYK